MQGKRWRVAWTQAGLCYLALMAARLVAALVDKVPSDQMLHILVRGLPVSCVGAAWVLWAVLSADTYEGATEERSKLKR